jgi:hypothetical protein
MSGHRTAPAARTLGAHRATRGEDTNGNGSPARGCSPRPESRGATQATEITAGSDHLRDCHRRWRLSTVDGQDNDVVIGYAEVHSVREPIKRRLRCLRTPPSIELGLEGVDHPVR